MEKNRRKTKYSLESQFFLYAVIPVVLGLGLISGLAFLLLSEDVSNFWAEKAEVKTELLCEELEGELKLCRQLAAQGKSSLELQHYMKEVKSWRDMKTNSHYEGIRRLLDSVAEEKAEDSLISALWLVDMDSNIAIGDCASGIFLTEEDGFHFTDSVWAEQAYQSEDVFLVEPYLPAAATEPVISAVCPVRDWETQQLLGVFGVNIKVSSLNSYLQQEAAVAEKLLLLNAEGQILSHWEPELLLHSYEELAEADMIKRAQKTKSYGAYNYTAQGEERLACIRRLESQDWLVVTALPYREVHRSLQGMLWPMLLLFSAAIISSIFYEYAIIRRRLLLFLKTVEEAAQSIFLGTTDAEQRAEQEQEIAQISRLLRLLKKDIREVFFRMQERERHMTEGMEYAQLLQKRITSTAMDESRLFSDSFCLSRPVELVGGDFVWKTRLGSGIFIAVGDCSGHGMAGALLSVMTVSILRGITEGKERPELASVLWKMDRLLYESLNRERALGKLAIPAGVSLTLLYVDAEDKIYFAGAGGCLLWEKDGMAELFQGDKQLLGEGKAPGAECFTVHSLEKEEGVSYYLATDGFFAQPGGDRGLPFGYNRMKRVLVKYKEAPMETILNTLLEEFDYYRENEKQREDVTVFGFRL